MEGNNSIDKDCSALGGLFQTIVNDMRNSSVIWEDFAGKASKLHTSLKATLGAIGMFLDAFQKVADMATSSRGATKEIGSALTRLCLRHKSIEAKLKALTGSIVETLVTPLQEHSEEWKKTVIQLDKDHAREYKRARTEIKKAASDTMRLQKKVKKGNTSGKGEMQAKLDNAMHDINDKYLVFEESEKNAVRRALIEERGHYCIFVSCLRPFVEHEVSLITEITHLQEIMQSLCMQCSDPSVLPPASEQVIMDVKGFDSNSVWNFSQHSPPSSPSSLGSRKSSMCSISSINSSSSGSLKSHSPSHHNHKRNSAQDVDNTSHGVDNTDADSQSSTPSDNTPSASSTWTNWPNPPNQNTKTEENRPHTISTAYERNNKNARPALSATLFEPPNGENTMEEEEEEVQMRVNKKHERTLSGSGPPRPPSATINKMQPVLPPLAPKPRIKAVEPPKIPPTLGEAPTYVNMSDLANMAKEKQASSDNDQTPTEKSPPHTMSSQLPLDLEEAIRDLDNATASLHLEFEHDEKQMRQNSVELAKAIQELEASTAALQSTYDGNTSQSSLHSSSGYGTMNSTPAGSEDTIATGGIPVSHSGGAPITRRSSMNTPKPPPPVRRSSSITTANPATIQKLRKTPPRQLQANQGQPYAQPAPQNKHRRSSSSGGSEPAYAELQTIQQSIQARHQQQLNQQYQTEASPYATTATQNIPYSAPVTPQYAETNIMPPPSSGYVPPSSGHYTQHHQPQQPAGQAELMQKLNAKFQALNAAYSEKSDALPPPPPNAGELDHDLPPPPSQAELEEIEKIYSRPPPVNPKPTVNRTSNPENLRASLVSELKMGLRRVSSQDEGSEC